MRLMLQLIARLLVVVGLCLAAAPLATQGKIPQGAPVFPQWVIDRSKELRLSTGQVSAETQY